MSTTAPLIYLLDSGGSAWLIGVINDGQLTTTKTVAPLNQPLNGVILQDIAAPTRYWTVGVLPSGLLTASLTLSPTNQNKIILQAPNLIVWFLKVRGFMFGGQLYANLQTVACFDWTVGAQYDPKWNNVNWSQPGGVGTVVLPGPVNQLWANYPVPGGFFSELTGLWTAFCGHWFDAPMIQEAQDCATGQNVALVCCPVCSGIQYAITPFNEAVYADPQFGIPYVII
jgi:hypothetical protein